MRDEEIRQLIETVDRQIKDETDAYGEYQLAATDADFLGWHDIAATLYTISGDERRHRDLLEQIHRKIEAYLTLTADKPIQLHRPFPKTYYDWVDLGMDIYAKDNNLTEDVQGILYEIHEETSRADDAKRWLVRKANELGIT